MKREARTRGRMILRELLTEVLHFLILDQELSKKFQDHKLTGNWKDYRDCHIKPDLILVYRKVKPDILELVRLGSHSELGL
jgi:mRNA interferase YafQ